MTETTKDNLFYPRFTYGMFGPKVHVMDDPRPVMIRADHGHIQLWEMKKYSILKRYMPAELWIVEIPATNEGLLRLRVGIPKGNGPKKRLIEAMKVVAERISLNKIAAELREIEAITPTM